MTDTPELREMVVARKRALTPQIAEFTLAAPSGALLEPFTPGAHVTLRTPSGAMRRYSLVNDGAAPESYVIAVKREAQGRGGSASMHDDLAEGDRIEVGLPENDFALVDAPEYLLIAGGIGITPILGMARQLDREGAEFRLVYCTRSADETAYLDEVRAFGDRAVIHHDGGDIDAAYDFWDHFEKPGRGHVWCCGPAGLMEEVRALSGHWTEGHVHFEDFKPVEVVRADDRAFTVGLARAGIKVEVPADRTILEALRDAGVETVSSCESGTCGTCKTVLLEGTADHRDMVLMDEEKASRIMICISRAAEGDLVLDL